MAYVNQDSQPYHVTTLYSIVVPGAMRPTLERDAEEGCHRPCQNEDSQCVRHMSMDTARR